MSIAAQASEIISRIAARTRDRRERVRLARRWAGVLRASDPVVARALVRWASS
mgnify:CR=1 FL=1